jgi:hypothetical protein
VRTVSACSGDVSWERLPAWPAEVEAESEAAGGGPLWIGGTGGRSARLRLSPRRAATRDR